MATTHCASVNWFWFTLYCMVGKFGSCSFSLFTRIMGCSLFAVDKEKILSFFFLEYLKLITTVSITYGSWWRWIQLRVSVITFSWISIWIVTWIVHQHVISCAICISNMSNIIFSPINVLCIWHISWLIHVFHIIIGKQKWDGLPILSPNFCEGSHPRYIFSSVGIDWWIKFRRQRIHWWHWVFAYNIIGCGVVVFCFCWR